MGIILGRVFSRPRWRLIRERNRKMSEVYLDNDHLVDFRVEERSTGLSISDLQLTASLSRNPTGSAIQSFTLDAPTVGQFVSATTFSLDPITFISGPTTVSILTEVSQTLTTTFQNSSVGSVTLNVGLTETPVCSGQYIGTIPGLAISTALSQSLSSSFSASFSTSGSTNSLITSGGGGAFNTMAFTASVSEFTSSITESNLVQLVESDDRCFGVHETIVSGTFLKVATPMTLRSVRFLP